MIKRNISSNPVIPFLNMIVRVYRAICYFWKLNPGKPVGHTQQIDE